MADVSKIRVDGVDYDVKDVDARNGLNNAFRYLGMNPITYGEDTPLKWRTIGSGYAYITEQRLNNQPNAYGLLINYVVDTIVVQEFHALTAGGTYYRRANGTGWWADASDTGTWRKFYDTANPQP